jgi:hypothetical protein
MKPIARLCGERIEFFALNTPENRDAFRIALQIMADTALQFRGLPCESQKIQALDDAGLIDWDASE